MKRYSFRIDIEIEAESDPYDGFIEANNAEEAEKAVRKLLKDEHMIDVCDDVGIIFDEPYISVTVSEEE